MPQQKNQKRIGQPPEATEADYEALAVQFADMLIDPDKRWLLEYVLAGGFSYPIESLEDLPVDILARISNASYLVEKKLLDAALSGDRKIVVAFLMDNFHQTKPPLEWLSAVLKALDTTALRRSLQKASGIFKLRRGPNPKIPNFRYTDLAAKAELLTPVMFKLLTELQSGTKRSIQELLEFWKKDHDEGCSFLLRHIGRLRQALDSPALLKRGRKLLSRARVLAEALAGSDYGLTFSTSLVRVRQAKVGRLKIS
jgi:hypothetical protein